MIKIYRKSHFTFCFKKEKIPEVNPFTYFLLHPLILKNFKLSKI